MDEVLMGCAFGDKAVAVLLGLDGGLDVVPVQHDVEVVVRVWPQHFVQIVERHMGGLVIASGLAPGAFALLLVLAFGGLKEMMHRPVELP
jgi:hypothetical protein